MVESHLFGGLHNYLTMMRDSVEQAAERMRHGKDVENYTVTPLMRRIVLDMVDTMVAVPHAADIPDDGDAVIEDIQVMDEMILLANYRAYPQHFDPESVERAAKQQALKKEKKLDKPPKKDKAVKAVATPKAAKSLKTAKEDKKPPLTRHAKKLLAKKAQRVLAEMNNTVLCAGAKWIQDNDGDLLFIPSQELNYIA
jgi:hypothetical protein